MKDDLTMTKFDKDMISKIAQQLRDAYDPIIEQMDRRSNMQSFIADVLGDYIHDIGDAVVNNIKGNFPDTWEHVEDYQASVAKAVIYRRNAIINAYLEYLAHIDELNETVIMADDNDLQNFQNLTTFMSDVSADYYMTFLAGNMVEEPDVEVVKGLKYDKISMLNAMLKRANLREVEY